MHKIRKFQNSGLLNLSMNYQLPVSTVKQNQLNPINLSNFPKLTIPKMEAKLPQGKTIQQQAHELLAQPKTSFFQSKTGQALKNAGVSAISSVVSDKLNQQLNLFGDSELGQNLGTLFSSGIGSSLNTIGNNIIKGSSLLEGLGKNAGASLVGAGAGIAANYIGQGINALGGDSMLSRGIGQGIASGLGTVGGQTLSNLVAGSGASNTLFNSIKALKGGTDTVSGLSKAAAIGNIAGLAGTIVGSGLSAALGPSKEYGGEYGNTTRIMDTIYDLGTAGAAFIPGAGTIVSGALALNKGLSNIFGSTDGMTVQDAILGSAFMPAPVKWLNMWGSSKTGTFNNQSWQNSEKANSFMGDAFGNLNDRFNQARKEAGKTYGTFSQGAKRDAQKNIDFANYAWGKIMNMADQNEIQNIRSQLMSSINNQKYAQMIQGGFKQTAIGKQGMKIFNNATNHNIGMRLLSGAALIDNKQMILCNVPD